MRHCEVLYDDSLYTSESKMRVNSRKCEFDNAINAIESNYPEIPFVIIYDICIENEYHIETVSFKSDNPQLLELLEETHRRYWVRSFLEKRK